MVPKLTNAVKRRDFAPLQRLCSLQKVLLLVCLVALTNMVLAQTAITVRGTVLNAAGKALPGATVSVKGAQISVITDAAGKFIIKVPSERSVLVFSHVGMESYEQIAGSKPEISITLKEASANLEDVVVIGYGEVKKKDVTGAVGRVSVGDLQKAPVKSVDDALAGRVAGVYVVSNDGQPGANAEITIRGTGSITQSSSPLYVIDGFPQEYANFNALNPADIESMEVLKDASSTAIYGARGSNGVIIITTKKGKSAKPVLSYNGMYGAQKPIKFMKLLNAYEFVRLQNEMNPMFANYVYFADGKTLEDYKNAKTIDWQDLLFSDAPPFQNHNVSFSARVNKTAYAVSASYGQQDGLILNSGFKRYQARMVLDQEITDKLKVGINVNYANFKSYGNQPANQNTPPGQVVNNANWNFMTNLWSMRPVLGSRAPDNSFIYEDLLDNNVDEGGLPGSGRVNPYVQTVNEVNDRFTNTITANAYLQYKIINNLTFRSTVGVNMLRDDTYKFNNSKTNAGSPLTTYGQTYGVNGSTGTAKTFSLLNENTLTYNKAFNADHQLNAVIGATVQKNNNDNYGFSATNLPNESLGVKGLGQGTPYQVTSGSSLSAMRSYLARVNYTLFDNYLFTASFRADGTSKFFINNRWGYFPSGAIAWRLGNEKFMKNIAFVNDAKVRVSYGATGNNRVSDFAYRTLLTANTSNLSGSYYSFNDLINYNIVVNSMGNQNLKWEKGIQADAGLEFSLFNNRISVESDVYRRVTKDLLLNASMPYSTGFSTAYMNIGKVSNQGLELTFNTVNMKKKDFSWTSSFNISFNKNKLLALNNGEDALLTTRAFDASVSTVPDYIGRVGQPVAQFYGFIADGMYQLSDFYKVPNGANGFLYVLKDNIPYYGTKSTISNPSTSNTLPVQPGDPKFVDLNGDGLLDQNDYTVIGNPYPKNYGGFNNNFTYKNFDLNIFFQWSYGNEIINANRIKFEGGTNASVFPTTLNQGNISFNMFETYANRWTPENPSNLYPRANAHATGTRQYSTRIVEDGSYLRFKTLQFGYSLSQRWLKKAGVSGARFYVSAQNLLTFTKYTGPDPEVSTFTGSNLTPGFDYSPYPRTKTLTIGANLTL